MEIHVHVDCVGRTQPILFVHKKDKKKTMQFIYVRRCLRSSRQDSHTWSRLPLRCTCHHSDTVTTHRRRYLKKTCLIGLWIPSVLIKTKLTYAQGWPPLCLLVFLPRWPPQYQPVVLIMMDKHAQTASRHPIAIPVCCNAKTRRRRLRMYVKLLKSYCPTCIKYALVVC